MLAIHAFTPLQDDDEKPARKVNPAFNRLVHAYAGRAPLPLLARQEEREMIALVQDQGCAASLDRLVEHHMGYLVNIANTYAKKSGLESHADDFYSQACEGFMQAIRKFDLNQTAARLSTYARYFVVSHCLDYVKTMKMPFRVGTNLPDKSAFFGLHRIRTEFHEIYRRPMTQSFEDIQAAESLTGIPAASIERALQLEAMPPAFAPEDIQIHDMRAQDRPENRVARSSGNTYLQRQIGEVAASLIDRNRDILLTILKDPDRRAEFAAQLADKHGITVERVRQIYRGGVADIRAALHAKGMRHISDIA